MVEGFYGRYRALLAHLQREAAPVLELTQKLLVVLEAGAHAVEVAFRDALRLELLIRPQPRPLDPPGLSPARRPLLTR